MHRATARRRLVAMALSTEAFAEDCARTAVVISPREAYRACGAELIDRKVAQMRGAIALRWTGEGFERTEAQPPGYDRPWAREREQRLEENPVPPDATPRFEDLEAGD
jgi:competence protein ComEC